MKEGASYFLLCRHIFDSAIWRSDPDVLKLFIFLVGTARHDKEPKEYPGVTVERGDLLTSLSQLAEENEWLEGRSLKKWSRSKVARMLDSLVKAKLIQLLPDTYGTHIRIINYSTYQSPENYRRDSDGTRVKPHREHSETKVRTNSNVNNDNKDLSLESFEDRDPPEPTSEPNLKIVGHPSPDVPKHLSRKSEELKPWPMETSQCFLTDTEVERLLKRFSEARAEYLALQIHQLAKEKSKYKKYSDHYKTILTWDRFKVEHGKVWFEHHPTEGPGYYLEHVVQNYQNGKFS